MDSINRRRRTTSSILVLDAVRIFITPPLQIMPPCRCRRIGDFEQRCGVAALPAREV
jgi:hypothetical protein